MTATASPETKVRETAGRFSFKLCRECDVRQPHGYFHLPDDRKGGEIHLSKASARAGLELYVKRGEIPEADKSAIEEDINLSIMPEKDDHQNEGGSFGDIVSELMNILDPPMTVPEGMIEFTIVEVGTLKVNGMLSDGEVPLYTTKSLARKSISVGIRAGLITPNDADRIMKQIEASSLPE